MSKGTKTKTDSNGYLARDGLYYNGYVLSSDYVEDMDKQFKDICPICQKQFDGIFSSVSLALHKDLEHVNA